MSFSQFNFDSNISKALSACGYTEPTPIQTHSIHDILGGKDLIACAQTGTGKTAAFVLPALQRLTTTKKTYKPRILILTPTRELAAQITSATGKYGKFLRFNVVSLVGGMPYGQQLRHLSRPVDIIVATPGRLMDHMENRRIDLSAIEMLILDEADRMLDMGFIDDVKYIAASTPEARQTLLFSATVDDRLKHVIRQLLKDPTRVDLSQEKIAPAQIKQVLYMTDSVQHKSKILHHLLKNESIFKGIIFTATKIAADRLAGELQKLGYAAAALHGDLKQSMRNKVVEQFRRGKFQFVVATDVAARGIDISDVTHVINYDLPKFCEDYVHRIGRTGRAGKSGLAISLAANTDFRHLQKIERYINQKIDVKAIAGLEPSKTSFSKPKSKSKSKSRFKSKDNSRFKPKFKAEFKSKDRREKSSSDRRSSEFKPRFKDEFKSKDRGEFRSKDRREKSSSDRRSSEFKPRFKDEFKSKDRGEFRSKDRREKSSSDRRSSEFKPRFKDEFKSKDRGEFRSKDRREKSSSDRKSSEFKPRFKSEFKSKERSSEFKPKFKSDRRKDFFKKKSKRNSQG